MNGPAYNPIWALLNGRTRKDSRSAYGRTAIPESFTPGTVDAPIAAIHAWLVPPTLKGALRNYRLFELCGATQRRQLQPFRDWFSGPDQPYVASPFATIPRPHVWLAHLDSRGVSAWVTAVSDASIPAAGDEISIGAHEEAGELHVTMGTESWIVEPTQTVEVGLEYELLAGRVRLALAAGYDLPDGFNGRAEYLALPSAPALRLAGLVGEMTARHDMRDALIHNLPEGVFRDDLPRLLRSTAEPTLIFGAAVLGLCAHLAEVERA